MTDTMKIKVVMLKKTNAMAFIFHYGNNTHDICKQFDLCPKCKDELVKWILKGE